MRVYMTWTAVLGLIAGQLSCSGTSERHGPRGVSTTGETRSFHFEYAVAVRSLPPGSERVRLWIPLPQSDEAQTISDLKIASPVPHREGGDQTYGNSLAYLEFYSPFPESIPVVVSFDVKRREVSVLHRAVDRRGRERLLTGDRMAPINAEVRARSARATAAAGTRATKVRAIYDRVLADVTYDKSGIGWGKGDVEYVCREGKGNCSDFHTLFIAMARAEGIPAFFEIGFPLPVTRGEGEVGGYHCWAWYEDSRGVWRPVDASEADKNPDKREYFFGTLCCNRVSFTRGRDLVLEPRQSGEALNFMIHPYVEVDGKAGVARVEQKFRFRDEPS